ncbi:MAG: fimbria/pilus outer membrane usher protein [Bacteriovoracaceae bacterium]
MTKINLFLIFALLFSLNLFAEKESTLLVPLIIESQYEEMIKVIVENDTVVKRINIGPHLNRFKNYSNQEAYEKLFKSLSSDGFIEPKKLKQLGFDNRFDVNSVELSIMLDPTIRKKNIVSIDTKYNYQNLTFLKPANFSTYLNYYVTKDYEYTSSIQNPLKANFESAINIYSFVLEGDLDYVEYNQHPFQRRDVRLVKDFPSANVRAMLGDLRYDMKGYETYRPLAGISIDNDFSLSPGKISTALSSQDFYLKNNSSVKIFINDRFIRNLDLNAGNHSIEDLPIQAGLNDVRLEITDSSGRNETLNFLHHTSKDLLKKGTHDFNYTVGVPYQDENGVRVYSKNDNKRTISLFHRYAFTNFWSPGFYYQGDNYQSLAGLENTFSTPLGIFSIDMVGSDTDYVDQDYAFKIIYQVFDYHGPQGTTRRLSFSEERIGPQFATLGNLNPNNKIRDRFGASYSQNLWENMSVNLNLDYSLNKTPVEVDPYQLSLSFSNRWTKKLSSSLFLSRNRQVNNEWNDTAFVMLNYDIPEDKQSVNVFYDTQNENKRGDFNFRSQNRIGYVNGGVGVEQSDQYQRYRGSFGFEHEKFVTNFKHDVTDDKFKSKIANSSQFRFGQGIVWAQNRIAFSRPVSSSFAIISPNQYLKGEEIAVNPNVEGDLAHASYWNNGVVPSMSPYQPFNLQLDSTLISPGKNIGKDYYWLFPTYKSGHVIDFGEPGNILLIGYLIDQHNSPWKLIVGQLVNVNDNNDRVEFFTDKQGRFMIEGLKSGEYTIQLEEQKHLPTKMVIQDNIQGIFKIGNIVLKKEE